MVGETLGHYRVLDKLGEGGMGEVYTATDTRLDRTVAIKVLPSELAADPTRRARFEREAKAIAALSHPHICTLHEFDTQDGTDFLVMEYLEGETLAERLTKGALPLDQALRYGIEIADALDKAHHQGITHRDLKPGNVMLTKSGAKLLDFGLAKLTEPVRSATAVAERSTKLADPLTAEGSILGTFQYMAPEQLEGGDTDARTDIWALGCVLHEMLTGQKTFAGTSQASLIAAILEHEPRPLAELQPLTPPSLDRTVRRCLAKDPDGRWDTSHDLHDELIWIAEGGAQTVLPPPMATRSRIRARLWAVGGLVLAAVVALVGWSLMRSAPTPQQVAHFVIATPARPAPDALSVDPVYPDVAISPDGTRIVYTVFGEGGRRRLFTRSVDQLQKTALTPPGMDVGQPFFSPDGTWVGFLNWGDQALMKVAIHGGPPEIICSVSYSSGPSVPGVSWGTDDSIVFAGGEGLMRVPATGGTPEALRGLTASEVGQVYLWPEILPTANAILFVIASKQLGVEDYRVGVASLHTGERRILVGGSSPHYLPTGHLLFSRGSSLWAASFDLDRLELAGDPVPVMEDVATKVLSGASSVSVSSTGTLVYVSPGLSSRQAKRLSWVDRQGRAEPLPLDPGLYDSPSLSPDGRHVAMVVDDESGWNIWVYDIERNTLGKRTFEGLNLFPIWTPDSQTLAFSRGSTLDVLMRVPADGSSEPERLVTQEESLGYKAASAWSPDGTLLVFEHNLGIWTREMSEGASARPFLVSEAHDREGRLSPDGEWLAYRSDETGRDEVFVRPFPDAGGKWQISTDGGAQPMWAPNGQELFYTSGNRMMAVAVETDLGFKAGSPRLLFDTPLPALGGDPSRFSVSPDGQRFLVLTPAPADPSAEPAPPPQIHVVMNWFEELKRLVPTN